MWINGTRTLTQTFNAANQIDGLTYDAAGNLTDDGGATYGYDALNRLTVRSTTPYTYNGDGALVDDGTTRYTQDLASPLTQVLQTTQISTTDYLYGLDRLAAVAGSRRTWYSADALGSVRQTLSDTGAPLGVINYDPWGTVETGTVPTFGFTGELQDAGTGLVNLRARWYSTGNGTFTSRDSFAGNSQTPYSQHPYQYGSSDPVRNTDPTGHCSERGQGDDYCHTDVRNDYAATPTPVPAPGPLPASPPPESTPTRTPVYGKNVAQQILDESGGVAGAAVLSARGGPWAMVAGLFCVGVVALVASNHAQVQPRTDYVLPPVEFVSAPEPQDQPEPQEQTATPVLFPPIQPISTPTPDQYVSFYHTTDMAGAKDIVRNGVDTNRTVNKALGDGFYTWKVEAEAELAAINNSLTWPPDAAVARLTMRESVYNTMKQQGLVTEAYYGSALSAIFRPASVTVLNSHAVTRDWKWYVHPSWTPYTSTT